MRLRGVRYWWAGLGLAVLAITYAAPIGAAFRGPGLPSRTTPLPSLAVPAVPFPLLQVPKIHKQSPLPPLAKPAARGSNAAVSQHTTRKAVRKRVPVVSDTHSQAVGAPTSNAAKTKDPFADVPVVADTIGTPLNLPEAAPVPAAPAVATEDTSAMPPVDPPVVGGDVSSDPVLTPTAPEPGYRSLFSVSNASNDPAPAATEKVVTTSAQDSSAGGASISSTPESAQDVAGTAGGSATSSNETSATAAATVPSTQGDGAAVSSGSV